MFDSLFNRTLKRGVETGHFVQPKGMCTAFLIIITLLTAHWSGNLPLRK